MENAREDAGIREGMGEKGGSNSGGLYQCIADGLRPVRTVRPYR